MLAVSCSSEKCEWIWSFYLIASSSNELFVNVSSWKTSQTEILKLEISFQHFYINDLILVSYFLSLSYSNAAAWVSMPSKVMTWLSGKLKGF